MSHAQAQDLDSSEQPVSRLKGVREKMRARFEDPRSRRRAAAVAVAGLIGVYLAHRYDVDISLAGGIQTGFTKRNKNDYVAGIKNLRENAVNTLNTSTRLGLLRARVTEARERGAPQRALAAVATGVILAANVFPLTPSENHSSARSVQAAVIRPEVQPLNMPQQNSQSFV